MRQVYSIEQAAEDLDLPRRSLYNYVQAGLVPVEPLSENRVVILRKQFKIIREVLTNHGREGIRRGLATSGE